MRQIQHLLTVFLLTISYFTFASKPLTSYSFSDLLEQFNGDKTDDLKPNDFKEIYQLALDLPELQQYYHIDKDSVRKQIYIQHFGQADHNNLRGVRKFNKQIIILTKKEIATRKIKNYFVLGDWVCGQNSVRMQLSYVGEGLTVSYIFKKASNKWTIASHKLTEK